jgi:hypothetical protein
MIIYEGPSLIDGKPIIAIATLNSSNSKTGAMVQTWIMRSDIEPHQAIKTGDDVSVCGDCPHRPENSGSCYVLTFQAPLSVYRAYHRGSYVDRKLESFRGKALRLGSYGDPLAVPLEAWKPLIDITEGRTGYTHQWRMDANPQWKNLIMASVDNSIEANQAQKDGWRYFRVTNESAPKIKGESICPASVEAGKKLTCADCLSCGGQTGRKASIVINAHGSRASNYKLIRAVAV